MAIAVRGTPTNTNTTAVGTTITLTVPTGTVAGDVMVAIVTDADGTNATVTTPSGWTLLQAKVNETIQVGQVVFYKVAGASEPSVTITYGSSTALSGGITSFSGVNNTTVLSGTPTSSVSTTSTTSPQPVNMTTADTNAMVVACIGAYSATTSCTITAPSGFTGATNANYTATSRYLSEDSYALQATAGTTAIGVATSSASVGSRVFQTLALKPALATLIQGVGVIPI